MNDRAGRARFCDEFDAGFGWREPEASLVERTSHALASGGRVWIVDAVGAPGVVERVRSLGEPAGVIQLLDRHERDCAELAAKLAVPHHRVPLTGVPGSPFELVRIANLPGWREAALWWPSERTLVCADALGTVGYFLAPGERLGVHPLLRLTPPRRLGHLRPERILVGHGEGVDEGAPAALADALATARRRIPRVLVGLVKSGRG